MKVISKQKTFHGIDHVTHYKLTGGYEANVWKGGEIYAYTKKGNYTSQMMMHKIGLVISVYEQFNT